MMRYVFYCEDSPEGILSAVHAAYSSRLGHAAITLRLRERGCTEEPVHNLMLDTEYRNLQTEPEKAASVRDAIWEKLGRETAEVLLVCAYSAAEDKADVIYHFLVRAFANGPKTLRYRTDPYVQRLHGIHTKMVNETHHWREFLRFQTLAVRPGDSSNQDGTYGESVLTDAFEPLKAARSFRSEIGGRKESILTDAFEPLKAAWLPQSEIGGRLGQRRFPSEILMARLSPEGAVVPLLLPYFMDRYPEECLLILDSTHDVCGIYLPGSPGDGSLPEEGFFLGGERRMPGLTRRKSRHSFDQAFLLEDVTMHYPELVRLFSEKDAAEREMEELWRIFYRVIGIQERENRALQRSLMPLRFRNTDIDPV